MSCNTAQRSELRPCSSDRYHWNHQVQVINIKPPVQSAATELLIYRIWWILFEFCDLHRNLTYSYFAISTSIEASEVNKKLKEVTYLTAISPPFTGPCQHLRAPTSQCHICVQHLNLGLLESLCGHDWTMT